MKESANKSAPPSNSTKIKLSKPAGETYVSTTSKSKVADKGQARATKNSIKGSDKKAGDKKPEKSKLAETIKDNTSRKESEGKGTSQGEIYVLIWFGSVSR